VSWTGRSTGLSQWNNTAQLYVIIITEINVRLLVGLNTKQQPNIFWIYRTSPAENNRRKKISKRNLGSTCKKPRPRHSQITTINRYEIITDYIFTKKQIGYHRRWKTLKLLHTHITGNFTVVAERILLNLHLDLHQYLAGFKEMWNL